MTRSDYSDRAFPTRCRGVGSSDRNRSDTAMIRHRDALPASLRWSGGLLIAEACALLFWTLRTLGASLTDTVVTRKAHTLVINGPYRWVRHPFYDAVAMLLLAFRW
jgi:protein-S-isoprenylcysteine O-methyltransferase Ste14